MENRHLTTRKFSDFDLPEPVLAGLRDAGFQHMTPIQAEALPPALAGEDVAGQAQTGTGKTAAFLVATLARLLGRPAPEARRATDVRAVIVAPTRELAVQIHADAKVLSRHCGVQLGLVYGGTGYQSQREELGRGVDLLIGTPGRLIDYYKQGVFGLGHVEVAVIDEADRMFDLGFIRDIRYILRRMPPPAERLNLLFSATLSLRVTELAYEHMNNARIVRIEAERVTVAGVNERVYFPANEEKLPLLLGLLEHAASTRVLVFTNTRHQAQKLEDWLRANDIQAGVLSGDVPQKKREQLLQQFKDSRVRVLVATDVAARGLHIPDVSHVINYDVPQDAEDYVHRIGRTARAGASGEAITLACETYAFTLPDIEAYVGHSLPRGEIAPELLVRPQRPKGGGRRARGPREGAEKRGRGRAARPASGEKDDASSTSGRRRKGGSQRRPRDGQAAKADDASPGVPDPSASRQPPPAEESRHRRGDGPAHEPARGKDSAAQGGDASGESSADRPAPRRRETETPAIG